VGFRYGGFELKFREGRNLKDGIAKMANDEGLEGREIFMFTDNSTAEAAFYRGSSSASQMYNLVVELKELEMRHNCRLHIIHVAGTRMIDQGADGLSRGSLTEGVMQGKDMLSFIPINLSAKERSPTLKDWIWKFFYNGSENTGETLSFLNYDDWYERGHDILGGEKNADGIWIPNLVSGNFVWTPPPALALPCLEELRKARHKRQTSTHIFVCPRLMTPTWRRQLHRSADVIFEIPAGSIPSWNSDQHEPLLIGIFFPYLDHRPWQLKKHQQYWNWQGKCKKCSKTTIGTKDIFCGNFGTCREGSPECLRSWCHGCYEYEGDLEFFRQIPENDECNKWKSKKEDNRFNFAREGDSLFSPFQCDFCCIRKDSRWTDWKWT